MEPAAERREHTDIAQACYLVENALQWGPPVGAHDEAPNGFTGKYAPQWNPPSIAGTPGYARERQ